MSNRKPGDYVVNSELTTEQIERFVADCVEDGAIATHMDEVNYQDLVGWCKNIGVRPRNVIFNSISYARNVTHEYKTQPMTDTPDLPTVLEECAEHLRAGRDPRDYFEVNARENDPNCNGGWMVVSSLSEVLHFADKHYVRRRPPTITINGVEVPKPARVEGECTVSGIPGRTPTGATINLELTYHGPVAPESAQAIIKALRGESNE